MMYDLVVIGGGMAGLSAAFYARERGLNFLLLEASNRVGGCIQSELVQGTYVLEKGPNSLSIGPTLNEIIDKLKLNKQQPEKEARRKLIYAKDSLHEVSNPIYLFGSNFLSFKARLSLLSEAFRDGQSNPSEEESVAAFFSRRFGPEIVDLLIWPLLNGIYAGNPEVLSMQSVFPRLYEIEQKHKTLLGGLWKEFWDACRNKQNQAISPKRIVSFNSGLQSLTEALGQRLSEHIKCNSPVQSLEKFSHGFQLTTQAGEYLEAKKVVVAVPAHQITGLNPHYFGSLKQIEYAPVITMMVWAKAKPGNKIDHLLRSSFGFLNARGGTLKLLGVVFNSALFTGRAPTDRHGLTCFLGGALGEEQMNLNDAELSHLCVNDLCTVTGWEASDFDVKKITRWPKAIPQYNLGHKDLLETLHAKLPENLRLAGNYLSGVSLEETALSGKRVLDELFARA